MPSSWPIGGTQCGTPIKDTVVLPVTQPACAIARPPTVSSVEFSGSNDIASTLQNVTSRTLSIDGVPSTQTTGRFEGDTVIVVDLAAQATQVVVTSPQMDLAQRLVASLHIVSADVSGCPSNDEDLYDLPTGKTAARDGADRLLVPGRPTKIAVCRYFGGRFEQSAVPAVGPFVSALNAVPAGASRANPKTFLPELCRGATPSPGAVTGTHNDDEAYLIRASYASGADLDVVARLGLCRDLGASNGTLVVQRTEGLVDLIIHSVGAAGGYPGEVHVVR